MDGDGRGEGTGLPDLVPFVRRAEGFDAVLRSLRSGGGAGIDGAWGSSCALAIAALVREAPATVLVVLPRSDAVDDFAADVHSLLGESPAVFPAWESLPDEHSLTDAIFGARLRTLAALEENAPRVLVASLAALLQPVPPRAERIRSTVRIAVGDELDVEGLMAQLAAHGFERLPALEMPGEFALHGGILDVFPPDALDPVRIELFGDQVESLRRFDVETQRKIEDLRELRFTLVAPAQETGDGNGAGRARHPEESLLESLPSGSWVALVEPGELVEEGRKYRDRLDDPAGLFTVPESLARCMRNPYVGVAGLGIEGADATCRLQVESVARFSGVRSAVIGELAEAVGRDERVLVACHNEGERSRLLELLIDSGTGLDRHVSLCLGHVARGYRLAADGWTVVGDHELFGRTEVARAPRRKKHESRAIDSFLDLNLGDLVVHLAHGIGRFRGMKLLRKRDQAEEHLALEFKDRATIYVPVSLIHLVQKYVGASKSLPSLSPLGGTGWAKKKQRAAEAVTDHAADMLRMQAVRESLPGIAFPPDTRWQQEFEAAFPYQETDDQLAAIADIKEDMQRPRTMDRLVCGDVGYGKTEVALRAVFKAVDAGKQVAVLVPTTVLAEQHFRTFSERMAEYPFAIESLCRFRTAAEQRKIVEGLASGGVDVVVGTHRLVSQDVRFKDLGLLVIDEEQRFGVDVKERLKQMRLEVDVLTLSATPIPRTLHMSLLGIRDISNLTTPPQDRVPIETRIVRFDRHLVRQAIVRELNRNGQTYFVHNRIHDIHALAEKLQAIVPEARFAVGHGQMAEGELEETMLRFVRREVDVLVSTTIIESGLDIPTANTMFIDDAHRHGLSDLHQLRGRVGRYKHRAYCYLLTGERGMTPIAAKRLKAIEEYSELGAGFKIAMRDLEIRGAGNILGTEQSGHIAVVGYELYCQLLEDAVRKLRNEPVREHRHVSVDLPVAGFLPAEYVPPGRQKIDLYRRLGQLADLAALSDFAQELQDRYGNPPPDVLRLLGLRRLQILATAWQIDEIRLEERFAVFGYRDARRIRLLQKRVGSDLRIVDGKTAYCVLRKPQAVNDELLEQLEGVLRPG